MLRRTVITALAAATLAAPAQAAPIRGQTLMPGVVYSRQVEFTGHGPVVLNVVSAPRPQGLYSLRAVLSNGAVQGRERLTDMEKAVADRTTAVGIDGDFFDTRWGTPSGVLLRGGVLAAGSVGGRSAAGFDAGGTLHVDRVALDGSWKGTGQYRPLMLNATPGRSAVTLYTPAWGPATPPETGTAVEAVLTPFPAAAPNVTLSAPVAQVLQGGGQAIPAGGAVLVARGRQAQTLTAEAPAGTTVNVRLILTPRWDEVREAVGGGPLLVRNGRPVFRANETFAASQLFTRTARGAVGQTSDGRILFVSVDGGRPGYSLGLTSFELALALMRFGAVTACGLGTGAPTGLAFEGKLLSRPARGGETSVADALFFQYDGVFAPALPPSVAPGKTQTLVYKLVRRSTVTATLTGPSGRTTLDSGMRDPGTYRFDWTAGGDGRWTFDVDAVDDLGRSSSSERAFSVGSAAKRR